MLRDGETTTKIEFAFLRGEIGDRQENRPPKAVFLGKRHALQLVCATALACSGCSTGTKQAPSDAKFTAKSAKQKRPDPLQGFKVNKLQPPNLFCPGFTSALILFNAV